MRSSPGTSYVRLRNLNRALAKQSSVSSPSSHLSFANGDEVSEPVFEKESTGELEVPPIASSNSQAREVLRVWAAPGQPQQLTLRTTWKNAGAWGLLLADIARHAANAYANEGQNRAEVLSKIRQLLDAEFLQPTDNPIEHR